MLPFALVLTTCPSEEEAKKLAELIVKTRLVACANVIKNMESFFHWNGQIENENEVLLMMKTQKKMLKELFEWIKTHHSYDVPEILALPIMAGSEEYLNWIEEETS